MESRKRSTKSGAAEKGTDAFFQPPVTRIWSHLGGRGLCCLRAESLFGRSWLWRASRVSDGQNDPTRKISQGSEVTMNLKPSRVDEWVPDLPRKWGIKKPSQKKINENSRCCYDMITLSDRCLQTGFCRDLTNCWTSEKSHSVTQLETVNSEERWPGSQVTPTTCNENRHDLP